MKDYKFFILTLICIFLLSWSLMNHLNKFQNPEYGFEWPELNMPDLEASNQANQEKTIKEFTSSDGKLSFEYFSDWIETDEQTLGGWMGKTAENETDEKIIFLAQKILEDNSFMQMVVNEVNWPTESGLEEITQRIENSVSGGWTVVISNIEPIENGFFIEAVYQNPGYSQLYAKEKLLSNNHKYFLIEFFGNEAAWQQIEEEIGEIFDSTSLIP